jgi:hypothetical protein
VSGGHHDGAQYGSGVLGYDDAGVGVEKLTIGHDGQRTVNRTSDRLEAWKAVDRVYLAYNAVRYPSGPRQLSAPSLHPRTARSQNSRSLGGYRLTGDAFLV